MPEALLTVDEAAARLRMNPDTLRRQLRQGRIRSVRTGKLWRIPESALEAQDARPLASAAKTHLSAATSLENGPSEEELAALFAPPTPAEIARRLAALRSLAVSLPRRETPLDLSAEADPYGYDERAAQLMGNPMDDNR